MAKLFDTRNSLFGMLTRAPWWVSVRCAALGYGGVRLFFPQVALFAPLPFLATGAYSAYRQARGDNPKVSAQHVLALRAMAWEDFLRAATAAFRKQGYEVSAKASGADLVLRKQGRTIVVNCRRWKVERTGVTSIAALYGLAQKHEADGCMYLAGGTFTEQARAFAAGKPVTLMDGAEVAGLVRIGARNRRWWPLFRRL